MFFSRASVDGKGFFFFLPAVYEVRMFSCQGTKFNEDAAIYDMT
jgi:hypothetical protein